MRFRDHGLPDTATAAEIRDARGDHDIIFEQGDGAGLLKASLPGLQWRAVGGEEVLSLWEFSSIMLEPGMTLRGDGTKHFGGYVPGLAPLMSAWAEDRRLASEGFWAKRCPNKGAWVADVHKLPSARAGLQHSSVRRTH